MDLVQENQPRFMMEQKGLDSLSIIGLIANVIGSSTDQTHAVKVAERLVLKFKNVQGISRASTASLTAVKGMTKIKAQALLSAFALGARSVYSETVAMRFMNSESMAHTIIPMIGNKNQEHFVVIAMNRRYEEISREIMFKGGISSTIVCVKSVMAYVIENRASSFFVAHNHPSGNLRPSVADIDITNRLKEAGKVLDVKLLDHIVVNKNDFFSLRQRCKL